MRTLLYISSYPSKRHTRRVDELFSGTRGTKMVKTEISTQKKRSLEGEDDDAKRQSFNERSDQDNNETPTQRQLKLDKA